MKTIIDHQKIRSHALIANVMSIGGLLILLASVLAPTILPGISNLAFVLMVVGLGMAMVGIYFANRWVRKPRPEEKLDKALKSLNDSCHIFHYPALPCDHVLLTPSALVIMETVGLSGVFSYRNGKWKESMSIGRALRYIVEEHLGDPIRAANAAEGFLRNQFEKRDIPVEKIPIKPVVVFTHPAVELDIEGASIPVVKVDKLRRHIPTNLARMNEDTFSRLDEFFRELTVKD
jgi:hypothetical protein